MTANIESTEPEEPEKQEQDTQTTTAGENQTVSLKEIGQVIKGNQDKHYGNMRMRSIVLFQQMKWSSLQDNMKNFYMVMG